MNRRQFISTVVAAPALAYAGKSKSQPTISEWIQVTHDNSYRYKSRNLSSSQAAIPIWKNTWLTFLLNTKADGDLRGKTITTAILATWDEILQFGVSGYSNDHPAWRLYFSTQPTFDFARSQKYPSDYWWSHISVPLYTPGSYTIYPLPISPGNWGNALGNPSSTIPNEFDLAASSVTSLGVAFGSNRFGDVGIASWPAAGSVQLTSFSVM